MTPRLLPSVLVALLAGGCAGGFLGVGGPALTEDEVASMLAFEEYVNDSYLRRQRISSCENHRTAYNQVERSVRAQLPDTSVYVVDVVAGQRASLRTVAATRSWPGAGRVQAAFRHTEGFSPDSVEVRLWRNQDDGRPARWMVPRQGPVGMRLSALGQRALGIACRAG